MKKDKNVVNSEEKDMSFFKKMKTDKKYNAKVQFIGYGIFILVIIVFLNLGSMSSNVGNTVDDDSMMEVEDKKLIEKIDDNYRYNVNISLTKGENEVINYRYYGKMFDFNKVINKDVNGVVNTYYKVDDYYYVMNENEYSFIKVEDVYDLVKSEYIEVNGVMEFVNKSNLDHVTEESVGVIKSTYNLYVRDVVISVKNDDIITFNVVEEENKLMIEADYTNLMKVFDETITSVKIIYEYSDINSVEEFYVMEKINLDE